MYIRTYPVKDSPHYHNNCFQLSLFFPCCISRFFVGMERKKSFGGQKGVSRNACNCVAIFHFFHVDFTAHQLTWKSVVSSSCAIQLQFIFTSFLIGNSPFVLIKTRMNIRQSCCFYYHGVPHAHIYNIRIYLYYTCQFKENNPVLPKCIPT